jgi:hypothetical protein
VLALAGCGDDSTGASSSLPPVTSTPSTSAPTTQPTPTTAPGIDHPVGADEVVLRIGYEGGFVPVEYAFLNLPTLLVTGDGRLIVQGPVLAIYPGPLLPNVQVRTISEAGIQQLLELAAEHGLLTPREYANPTNIADAPDTVVTLNVNGETIEHRAYALGISEESDELRAELAAFVTEATGDWLYGDNPELGPEMPYTSDTFLIRATAVNDLTGYEIEPTVTDWPADLAPLADAMECTAYPSAALQATFDQANQLTFFTDDDTQYQLTVKPLLPGDSC